MGRIKNTWPSKVHTIWHHYWTGLDERIAHIDAYHVGEQVFPGIRTAKVRLTDAGPYTPDERPASEWESEGNLPLGIWQGFFDEHGMGLRTQGSGVCAATMMAEFTGSMENPAWSPILKYTSANDSKGKALHWELAQLVKDLNDFYARPRREETVPPEVQWEKVQWMVRTFVYSQIAKNRGLLSYDREDTNLWIEPAEWVALWIIDRFSKSAGLRPEDLVSMFWASNGVKFRPINRSQLQENIAFTVAKELGFDPAGDDLRSRSIQNILKFTDRKHHDGAATSFDLATLVLDQDAYWKHLHGQRAHQGKSFSPGERFTQTRNLVWSILDAKRYQQEQYMAAEACVTDVRYFEFTCFKTVNNQRVDLAVTSFPNSQAHKVARAQRPKPDIIIVNHRGHVSILSTPKHPLEGVHQRLIREEMHFAKISREEAEKRWSHFRRNSADWEMNGGLSAPHRAKTAIPLRIIQRDVIEETRRQ